jgi:GNAT superfamily N-acetyltransferase
VFYQNVLELPRAKGVVRMQVGLATVLTHETSVGWTSDDFFVPPSLWGAGIGWDFLQKLLTRVSARASWCHVVVKAPPDGRRHQVARDDRQGFVDQYRKIGFREARPGEQGERSPVDLDLCRQLGYDEAEDTLLVLDLAQWARRQQ